MGRTNPVRGTDDLRKKRILVADDEPHILRSLQFLLKKEGYSILTAADGEEALGAVKTERPDLIFLDVMMPRMDGYEVCRLVKSDPQTRDTYVIMLTAKGQKREEALGLEAGADEYVTKPFSPRRLAERMHEILGA